MHYLPASLSYAVDTKHSASTKSSPKQTDKLTDGRTDRQTDRQSNAYEKKYNKTFFFLLIGQVLLIGGQFWGSSTHIIGFQELFSFIQTLQTSGLRNYMYPSNINTGTASVHLLSQVSSSELDLIIKVTYAQ